MEQMPKKKMTPEERAMFFLVKHLPPSDIEGRGKMTGKAIALRKELTRLLTLNDDLLAALEAAKIYVALGVANSVKTTAQGRAAAAQVHEQVTAAIAKAKPAERPLAS
jgi:hypothetical protein